MNTAKNPLTPVNTSRIVRAMTGKELKSIRKSLGLTQADFAALVGVAPNSIARQERGEMGIREPLARLRMEIGADKAHLAAALTEIEVRVEEGVDRVFESAKRRFAKAE